MNETFEEIRGIKVEEDLRFEFDSFLFFILLA
jgi:hypothetical protein